MTTPGENATTLVLMAFLGVLLGLLGSVVSAARIVVGSVTLPWGLVLVVLTLAVAVRAVVWSTGDRWAAGLLLGGWFAASAVLLLVSPGGDVILPDVPRTYVYLGSAFVLGLLALLWRLPEGHAELLEPDPDLVPGDNVLPWDGEEPSGEPSDVR